MTWTKLSDDFSDQCAASDLSDAAYRTHVEGLQWTMRRETGGRVSDRDLLRFAETGDPQDAAARLVAAGYWLRTPTGYLIVHHMEHQPDPELLEQRRKLTAERVRRHRRKLAGLPPESTDVTPLRDALPGSGRDGTGKPSTKRTTSGEDPWPPAAEVPA